MNSRRVAAGCRASVVLAAILAGCGGAPDVPTDRPQTVPVEGIVTYKGAAVPGASISFKNTGDGPGASGISDESGNFNLTTFGPGDGAVEGEYLVGVVKTEIVGADNSYFDEKSPNYGKTPPPGAEGKPVFHVPEKYNNPDTSGVRATVSAENPQVKIELVE